MRFSLTLLISERAEVSTIPMSESGAAVKELLLACFLFYYRDFSSWSSSFLFFSLFSGKASSFNYCWNGDRVSLAYSRSLFTSSLLPKHLFTEDNACYARKWDWLVPCVGFAYVAAQTPGEGSVETFPDIYIILLPYVSLLDGSEDPNQDISALLAKYSSNPESEPQLKLLLPLIASCFGGNKTVNETIEELKKHHLSSDATLIITEFSTFYEQWQSEPRRVLQGLEKELPFRSA
ncbi:hypothetical protein Vadar_009944 [Vaccinium darrowii]|uniref:Uncharacterized protein n=1 Tax=Vaccinium darrowii TaxID=229202 RepID=A0ACB7XQY1_9ERIC|nr:hypothetical protein Vadar_009944 [Vaccinium darrowii]